MKKRLIAGGGLLSFLMSVSVTVNAIPFEILYETDSDTNVNEMVINSLTTWDDLINYNYAATIVDVDISASYSSTGMTYDGSSYHILYEADSDTNTNEMVINSFASWDDLINYNYTATIVDVDISAAYSSTGLTFDGSDYHILYETDVDTSTNELVINSFNSLDDLINYNYAATIVDVDISSAYSSTGFTYDYAEDLWHILYETDTDTNINEMVINTFDSFADIINYNYLATIIDVDISGNYSSTGFCAICFEVGDDGGSDDGGGAEVPEPSSLMLLLFGLISLFFIKRRSLYSFDA